MWLREVCARRDAGTARRRNCAKDRRPIRETRREADAAEAARCTTRDGHAGQGWLILGHASEGRDHLLFVVELSWKITRGVLVPEADRATQKNGHGFIRCQSQMHPRSASIRIALPRLIMQTPRRKLRCLPPNSNQNVLRRTSHSMRSSPSYDDSSCIRRVTAMCAASPNAACCVASWPSQK